MRPLIPLTAWLIAFIPLLAAAEPEKVPESGAVEDAKKLVRDLYKAEFAKKKTPEMLDLARRLHHDAEETKDPAARFVMLREARDLAARGGDVVLCMDIAATTTQLFAVSGSEVRAEALEAAEKAKAAPGRAVAEAALDVAEDAVRVDDYTMAERMLKLAGLAASRATATSLSSVVSARLKDLDAIRKASATMEPVRKALAANPNDADANAKLGRFNCLLKGHWDVGLPMLAKGNDELLKAVAALDLEKKAPTDRAAVGDRWMDVVEKFEPGERPEIRMRAYTAYQAGAYEATGLEKTRLDRRITELEKLEPKIARLRGNWTVIFRSADPALWNTNTNRARDQFAIPIAKVAPDIRYLKMTELVKNTSVIIEMSKTRLGERSELNGFGWNGKAPTEYQATLLGIYDLEKGKFPKRGDVCLHYQSVDSEFQEYRGWGFGYKMRQYMDQGYSWNAEATAKLVFEISVKSSFLTSDEAKQLLKKQTKKK